MLIPGGMHTEKLRKGDIILSAAQTKSLLKIGRANGHGRAYAEGTLGPAYARGSSKSKDKKKDKKEKEDKPLKKFQEWFAKLFDWIEIRLKRQTDNITNYTKKADAALKSNDFGSANANYRRAIGATAIQIESERNAAGRYQRAANDVLKKAVKSGLIVIFDEQSGTRSRKYLPKYAKQGE